MKKLLLLAALTGSVLASYGQGTVVFNNNASPSFNIYTNGGSGQGLMSGANAYRLGLYAAPGTGVAASSLTLVGLATNAPLAGKFNGGSAFVLPNGFGVGNQLTFQIRAWSFAGGMSYEEALTAANVDPFNIILGGSAIGTTTAGGTTPGGPVPAGALFGTNPGQIGGFVFPVPEPSTATLALLGISAFTLFRRKK